MDGMSLALYRKYRPATFAEVKGQEHVTAPLQQALRNGRINHAYLFSGPRGCGKTTSARILARSLNCEKGPTPEPCGVCDSCVALGPNGAGSIDVIEIDAASHGGVDDARDLREKAFFAPVNSRFKVYIIDEAHMVTREGFNALLKLVEEPPPHLIFVFATTEPEKVIGTIRSRTHHYPFRLVPPGTLRELLEEILDAEGVPYEPAALPLVVRAGAGSARDAESILDQLLAGADASGITYERTVSLLGYTDASLLDEVVDAFASGDGAAVFQAVDRVIEGGHDPRRFAADLLERMRDLVVLAAVPDAGESGLLDVPPDELEAMKSQAGRMGQAELTRAAEVFSTGLTEMRGATAPRLLLELMCARVLLPGASDDVAALLTRLERVERRLSYGADAGGAAAAATAAPVTPAAPPAVPPRNAAPASAASPGAGPGSGDGATDGAPVPGGGRQGAAGGHDGADGSGHDAGRPAEAAGGRSGAEPGAPEGGPASDSGRGVPQGGGASGDVGRGHAAPGPAQGARNAGAAAGADAAPGDASWDAPGGGAAGQAPGGGQAAQRTAAPGELDVAAVRRAWGDVLEAVKRRRRVAWMILINDVQVQSLDKNVLTLGFARDGDMKGFTTSGSDAVVQDALTEVLGVSWRVMAAPGGGGQAAPSQGAPPQAPPTPPSGPPPDGPGDADRPARPQGAAPSSPGPAGGSGASGPGGPSASGDRPGPSASGGASAVSASGGAGPGGAPASGGGAGTGGAGRRGGGGWSPGAGSSAGGAPNTPDEPDPENDADADPAAEHLSGVALVQRELGATVIEEFDRA